MKWAFLLFFVSTLAFAATPPATTALDQLQEEYDVVIAGAGTGGFGAAMQAARMGATVLLLEETDWIGGQMNAAAVTSMDEGPILVRERGLYHEFFNAVTAHYRNLGINAETAYNFRHLCLEPRVGQKILYDMLAEGRSHTQALHVSLTARVTKVLREGNTVTGVEVTSGKQTRTLRSKILIDATEWGDVIPLTGARYRVGNCLNDDMDPKRRIQDLTWTAVIKQYPKGVPADLLMKAPPPGYTPAIHQYFLKTLAAGDKAETQVKPWSFTTFLNYRGMPNSEQPNKQREITRTHMNFNNDYPTTIGDVEDPASRKKTLRAATLKTLHLLYYIQTTLGKTDWSVANDEGYDTPYNREQMEAWIQDQPELAPYRAILHHFSIMAYARESRRIIGVHTLKAREIERKPRKPTPFTNTVALGDYAVDIHGPKKPEVIELELDPVGDIPTGDFGSHGTGPFAIPFESFIPETLDGFLPAEKNISQSRLVNGATRLQPSTMLMGQAAGAIAALSIRHQVKPRDLDPIFVQQTLLESGDTLNITPFKDVAKNSWEWVSTQLVTVRGLMELDGRHFHPAKPLTSDAANLIFKREFNTHATFTPPITRMAFAQALQAALAAHHVTLTEVDAMQGAAVTFTRRDAAAVLNQALLSLAQARLSKKEQKLPWPAQRAATVSKPEDLQPQLAADLRVLLHHGLLTNFDYWIKYATEDAACDGKHVGSLLQKTAHKLQPQRPEADALAVCVEEGVLSSLDYWQKQAVEGKTCAGSNVQIVLRRIAQILVTHQL